MKGIILHGGHGTRLRPLTHTGPKQLLPIANKPMSQYGIESLKDADVIDIAIIVGGVGSNKVKEYYGDGSTFGVNLTYIEQDSPKGIAHAISLCEDFIDDEKFVVFLGDNIINTSISNFKNNFEDGDFDASLLLCEVDNPSQFGIVYLEKDKILQMIEKPKEPKSNLAITGIYFLTPKIFEKIKQLKPSWRNEFEIVDALQLLLEERNNISYDIITEFWKDTGTPDDIIHANRIILDNIQTKNLGTQEKNVDMTGNVSIGKNSIIKNNCKIIGPVIIGEDCILENNCIIGPNVSIGNNCKIANSQVENSIIMDNCIIDSEIFIENSIISDNCQIISKKERLEKKKFLLGESTKISF